MSGEKTEEPTDKSLEKAREEGEVSKSTDLVDGALLAAGILVLIVTGDAVIAGMLACVNVALDFASGPHDAQATLRALGLIRSHIGGALLPFVAAAVIAPLFALATQVGVQISMTPVSFKFEAINPMSGIQRIFSLKSLLDLLKMIIKGIALIIVMWVTITNLLPLVAGSMFESLPELSKMASQLIIRLLSVAAVLYMAFGAVDVKLQKFLFIRSKKMSKDDIKREHKQDEGDPLIKMTRRMLQREMVNAEPPNIKGASMLVVNPTHYAVAVRYAPDEYALPRVIAKGMSDDALRMRREAQQAGIPIVGHPPVARALHKVELGQPIPEELFDAVAAILRWVASLGLPANTLDGSAAHSTVESAMQSAAPSSTQHIGKMASHDSPEASPIAPSI